MRRSEICRIQDQHVCWENPTLDILVTKNKTPRTIPLTDRAILALKKLKLMSSHADTHLAQLKPDSITQAFDRACKKAGVKGAVFHSPRHTACIRRAEAGLTPLQISALSGHKSLSMVMRYSHPDPSAILKYIQFP
jgi:integrase